MPVKIDKIENQVSRKDYSLHYEILGHGPIKLMFVMGFMCSYKNWDASVDYFLSLPDSPYSCLIFDNRGTSSSTQGQLERYKTSAMAVDALAVMDHAGWDHCHAIGISMGGMIALELGALVPDRILSLHILGSCAQLRFPTRLLWELPNMAWDCLLPTVDFSKMVSRSLPINFSRDWLDSFNPRYPEFATNRQRLANFIAPQIMDQMSPRYLKSLFGQACALLSHAVTVDKLTLMSQRIKKIVLYTGTDDLLIPAECTDYMATKMPNARVVKLPGVGHVLHLQAEEKVHAIIKETVDSF